MQYRLIEKELGINQLQMFHMEFQMVTCLPPILLTFLISSGLPE